MSNMTDVTIIEGFPRLYTSRLYFEALEEAASLIKEHKDDEIFPKESLMQIVRKAIGPTPAYDDSTDTHNMSVTKISFEQYNKDVYIFLKRALIFSN